MPQMVFELVRYILPILAVIILALCLVALLRRRTQPLGPVQLVDVAGEKSYPIVARETSIGKHKNCDISLDYDGVARQHAVLICAKDGWYIKEISTSCPVVVNGKRIEKMQMVTTGDKIDFGKARLFFENRKIIQQEIKNNGKKEK